MSYKKYYTNINFRFIKKNDSLIFKNWEVWPKKIKIKKNKYYKRKTQSDKVRKALEGFVGADSQNSENTRTTVRVSEGLN